jgi:opacity protein-like surface antigen
VKNFIRVLLFTGGLILFINSNSYALVDISAYGGFGFKGEVAGMDYQALPYGLKAHYNTSLVPMLELGLGVYYQGMKVKFDYPGSDWDVKRQTFGLDMNLILDLPIIHPYGRFTYGFWDKFDGDSENYKAWGLGAGIELTVIPFFRLFGEYNYDVSDHSKYDAKYKTNSILLGLKFDF